MLESIKLTRITFPELDITPNKPTVVKVSSYGTISHCGVTYSNYSDNSENNRTKSLIKSVGLGNGSRGIGRSDINLNES